MTAAAAMSLQERLPWLRPLVVRVGINTLTLLGALLLFDVIRLPGQNAEGRYVLDEPLLDISNASLFDFVLLGLSLALVSAFVRPVLVALSGSLVLRTYGLVGILVNAIVYWLAVELVALLTYIDVSVPEPRILWFIVVTGVLSFLLLAVDTVLGLRLSSSADGCPRYGTRRSAGSTSTSADGS